MVKSLLIFFGIILQALAQEKPNSITVGKVGEKTFTISPNDYQGEGGDGGAWTDALTFCQRAGQQLASLETKEEITFVSEYLRKVAPEAKYPHVWLAGTDYFQEGEWYWLPSRKSVDFSLSKDSDNSVTQNEWYNCLVLSPSGNFQSNYCGISYGRALCQNK